jgi:hypothetical protein
MGYGRRWLAVVGCIYLLHRPADCGRRAVSSRVGASLANKYMATLHIYVFVNIIPNTQLQSILTVEYVLYVLVVLFVCLVNISNWTQPS